MKSKTSKNTDAKEAVMEAMYDESLKNFTEGTIVPGKIIRVMNGNVLIDIGYKSEGVVPVHEFKDLDEDPVGQETEVFLECLEDSNGRIVISKRHAEQQRAWKHVANEYEEGSLVEGIIKKSIKGGFIVDIGVDTFLPGSQLDVMPVRNSEEYLGKTYQFRILKFNLERNNIVISRRELLEESNREARLKIMAEIKVGQIRQGEVKNITDYGAFVDIGGIVGLLHFNDMSWKRIHHPSDLLKVGDEVNVMILEINSEKGHISLGLKQTKGNPWKEIEARYPIGGHVHGKVVDLAQYGAFVELEEGVEGLVHVSEMSWTKRIYRATDVLKIGDEIDAVVLAISSENRRISLGMRQAEGNIWELFADKYAIGSLVKGKVHNFTDFGAFIKLEEGIDGLIHVSDMSWTRRVNHPSEMLKKGQEIETVILEINPSAQRINLGLKQTKDNPWVGIANRYPVGVKISAVVTRLSRYGAFVEIEEGIEGLVHISQISEERVKHVKDVLNIGDTVEARIVKVDPNEHRIGLSIKAANMEDAEFEVQEEMLEGLHSEPVNLSDAFNDVLADQLEEWRPGDSGKKEKEK